MTLNELSNNFGYVAGKARSLENLLFFSVNGAEASAEDDRIDYRRIFDALYIVAKDLSDSLSALENEMYDYELRVKGEQYERR